MYEFASSVHTGPIVRSLCIESGEWLTAISAGYPITTYILDRHSSPRISSTTASNVTNITSLRGLVDPDTPAEAYTRSGYNDSSKTFKLVFSDEFENDGEH